MNREEEKEIKEKIRDIFYNGETLAEICNIVNVISNECQRILNRAIEERR